MANTPTGSELDAMAELVKQMWERFIRPRVMDELMKHSLEGYKASVVSNNGDGTLTVVRPFDTQTMTLRCPPALANWAEEGDQVLVVSLGDASNSFILCKTDMEGFGSSATGERIKNLDFSHLISNYFTVKTEHDVLEMYTVSRDEHGRIDQIEDSEGFETGVDWPEYEPLPARDVGYDPTDSGASSTNVQDALDELFEGGGGGGTAASAVSYDNTGSGLAADNVQDAIDEVYGDIPTQPSDIGAQAEITASGILKGDGVGGVTAAVAGTDYATPAQLADKANQAQLATVETGSTASRAYAVGEFFCLNGLLYRVISAISSGQPFNPGANCEATTVGDEFENLYTIDGTSVSATANTDTNISITAPSGYRYGVFCGFSASSDYTKITLIAVVAQGTNYPNRIRFRSTVAQTVTARVLWFK